MISLRLPRELEEKLTRLSALEKKTRTEIIKESLQMYIESRDDRKSAYELATRHFGQSTGRGNQGSVNHQEVVRRKIKRKHNA
ncbi:MAG: transcriptional regulator [Spirochaetaceae bacterium]|nr:transcriptional regulator [Spirochaetaceae bacterium]|tara:strand:+ start:66021 stop:66269 length:249 start_codon:yes stop_codon:yes gene_type:complete